ncbi:chaperone protein dnaJ C76, chloroplastic [Rhodamnia argentea]|uniref:Chaperone protein dnaJ C76, chloroplastic n=1 Tax=Rhodamnia argentea TaxID=178133 RepID=A0A8B8PWS0_9MYRT|nr:chaperone protein dnaJ C76, chloroplastic [Rhodamnia argentea]
MRGHRSAMSAFLSSTPKFLPSLNFFRQPQFICPERSLLVFHFSCPFRYRRLPLFQALHSQSVLLRFFFYLLHAVRMAQLMSSVCADALKFQNPVLSLCSRSPCRVSAKAGAWNPPGCGARRRACGRVKVATDDSAALDSVAGDYYAVLGLLPDATQVQIKKAYYNCMKECHPDLSGNDPETNNFCMFINEVYAVLSDPMQRMVYDEIHGYSLTAVNPFLDDSCPKDHAFVDEFSCIGCKNCTNVAPDVFAIEEDFGRARVYSQCGNPDLVQQAIDSCPVDCIHWTSAPQLSLLEDEMRRVERVNVAMMLSGMGSGSMDVFRMANSRWEKRQAKVLEKAKIRMKQQKNSGKSDSYWSDLWGKPKDNRGSEEQVNDRARRAAAAARRWREYSRRGVDKPPTFKLPESASNTESTP